MIRKVIKRICTPEDMTEDARCPQCGHTVADHWKFASGVRACRDIGCDFACLGSKPDHDSVESTLERNFRGVQRSRFASSDVSVSGGK